MRCANTSINYMELIWNVKRHCSADSSQICLWQRNSLKLTETIGNACKRTPHLKCNIHFDWNDGRVSETERYKAYVLQLFHIQLIFWYDRLCIEWELLWKWLRVHNRFLFDTIIYTQWFFVYFYSNSLGFLNDFLLQWQWNFSFVHWINVLARISESIWWFNFHRFGGESIFEVFFHLECQHSITFFFLENWFSFRNF